MNIAIIGNSIVTGNIGGYVINITSNINIFVYVTGNNSFGEYNWPGEELSARTPPGHAGSTQQPSPKIQNSSRNCLCE